MPHAALDRILRPLSARFRLDRRIFLGNLEKNAAPQPVHVRNGVRLVGQRDQRFRDRLREDPEVWEAHLARKNIAGKKARERLKLEDPVAWAAFLKRRREYLRKYRRERKREAVVA